MAGKYITQSWTSARLRRRRLLAGAGAGAAAIGLAACGSKSGANKSGAASSSGGGTGTPKRGGAVTTFRKNSPPEGAEPHGTRSESADFQFPFSHVFSTLLRVKVGQPYKYADRTLEGELVSKWEQPDSQTITFTLKPGVKFHNRPPVNGRVLTSEDVKFSFERLLNSPFAYLNFFNSIGAVQIPDAQTVVLKTKAPDATLIPNLSLGFAWIIAKEAGKPDAKGTGGLSYKEAETAIGTGPFMLEKLQQDAGQSLVRNPEYFESGLPYLDRLDYVIIPDFASQLSALRSAKAAFGPIPAGSEADLKATNPNLTYLPSYNASAWFHGMRVDKAPFNDVRVRRAISMSYDQKNVNKVLGTPDAPLTFGSVTANTGDAWLPLDQLGENAQWWKPDAAAAKQLLAAAGYPNGFETTITVSDCCQPTTLPELFAADMAKIGIKVNIVVLPHPSYQATTVRGQYEGMTGSQFPIWDADDWFSNLLPGAARNVSHVDDAKVKELQPKERTELDPKKRLEIIHELVRYLAGQSYQITHPQQIETWSSQPSLKNFARRIGYQPEYMALWLDK